MISNVKTIVYRTNGNNAPSRQKGIKIPKGSSNETLGVACFWSRGIGQINRTLTSYEYELPPSTSSESTALKGSANLEDLLVVCSDSASANASNILTITLLAY